MIGAVEPHRLDLNVCTMEDSRCVGDLDRSSGDVA